MRSLGPALAQQLSDLRECAPTLGTRRHLELVHRVLAVPGETPNQCRQTQITARRSEAAADPLCIADALVALRRFAVACESSQAKYRGKDLRQLRATGSSSRSPYS